MALLPGPNPFAGCSLLTTLLRLGGAPASWFTNFVDSAEEIWVDDPFLSDDDGALSPWTAPAPVSSGN